VKQLLPVNWLFPDKEAPVTALPTGAQLEPPYLQRTSEELPPDVQEYPLPSVTIAKVPVAGLMGSPETV
jgi:hypothetical protein